MEEQDAAAPPGRKSRAPAAKRTLRILEFLADSPGPLGVNVIARELEIVPSTCFHILRALEENDYVTFDEETKKYQIGLGSIRIARRAIRQSIPLHLVQGALNSISIDFGVTTCALRIDSRDQMVVVAVARGEMPVGVYVELGLRLPAYLSATGQCYAAHSGLSRTELKAKFQQLHWGTPPTFGEWMERVEQARLEGFGVDRGSNVPGFTFISVPIFADGEMSGSVAAVLTNGQVSEQSEAEIVNRLRKVSASITS